MARIKKKGLDYFPVSTGFINDRSVRRLVKREGDCVLGILLEVFSNIYAGEGYYLYADRLFYEDIAEHLYEHEADDVERIVGLAVEYGLFDERLFAECGILTSREIQEQYLFVTRRRRNMACLNPSYSLLDDDFVKENEVVDNKEDAKECVTIMPENVTIIAKNVASGTHSIAQNSTVKQSKESPPLSSPPEGAREEGRERNFSSETPGGIPAEQHPSAGSELAKPVPPKRQEWTQERIDALLPPSDGVPRNYSGLLENLRLYRIPPPEQYAIIRKSNYGAIGDSVWKGLAMIRASCGKIKLPGRYLLSILNSKTVV